MSVVLLAAAVWLLMSSGARRTARAEGAEPVRPSSDQGLLKRWRWLWVALAGGGALFIDGLLRLPAAAALMATAWWLINREVSAGSRRRQRQAAADLPTVVLLLASALRIGTPTVGALKAVQTAYPGPAADRLDPTTRLLALGGDPVAAWALLADDEVLAPLGRTMKRAHQSGAPVADAVERLARDLAERRRLSVEGEARTVGVKAAVPLGGCFLPAFVILGIVPMAASLLWSLFS